MIKSLNIFLDKHLSSTKFQVDDQNCLDAEGTLYVNPDQLIVPQEPKDNDQNLENNVRMQLKNLDQVLEQIPHDEKLKLHKFLRCYEEQHEQSQIQRS